MLKYLLLTLIISSQSAYAHVSETSHAHPHLNVSVFYMIGIALIAGLLVFFLRKKFN